MCDCHAWNPPVYSSSTVGPQRPQPIRWETVTRYAALNEVEAQRKRIAELEQNLRLADAVKHDLENLLLSLHKRTAELTSSKS